MKTVSAHVRILDEGEVDQSQGKFFFPDVSMEDTSTLAELLHELHSKLGMTDVVLQVLSANVRNGETESWHSAWIGETVADGATYDFLLALTGSNDGEVHFQTILIRLASIKAPYEQTCFRFYR